MRSWVFGRKLNRLTLIVAAILLAIPLLWLQFGVQAQSDDEAATSSIRLTIFSYLPVLMTPAGPPEVVDVVRFNQTPLMTCGVADIAHAGDDRLFVAQQDGLIRILDANGDLLFTPFIDLTSQVTQACSDQYPQAGLLGLAFHPNYSSNGQFFVTYTRLTDGAIVLSRFTVSDDPNVANAGSEQRLLVVEKSAELSSLTHNGGDLTFGPSGHLFVALGDGDTKPTLTQPQPGDSANNAQRTDTLLGKLLRLDVDGGGGGAPDCGSDGYRIPSENKMADGAGGACDEVWARGLRAPWGVAYDTVTERLFVADSAEYQRNEINRLAGDADAPNLGWRCAEGLVDHSGQAHVGGCPAVETLTAPLTEYSLASGCRVIGGHVHGPTQHTLNNHYLFSDACASNKMGRIDLADPELPLVWMDVRNLPTNVSWNASGADAAGNLYFSEFSFNPSGPVNIYRVVDPQLSP